MQRRNLILFCFSQVGNKDDNPEKKVVVKEDAVKFAEQMGIQVFETSAKDNKNVEDVRIVLPYCMLRSAFVLGKTGDTLSLCSERDSGNGINSITRHMQ